MCEILKYEAIPLVHNFNNINSDYHKQFWWKNWATSSIKQNEGWGKLLLNLCPLQLQSHSSALPFSTMLMNWQEWHKMLKGIGQFLAEVLICFISFCRSCFPSSLAIGLQLQSADILKWKTVGSSYFSFPSNKFVLFGIQ